MSTMWLLKNIFLIIFILPCVFTDIRTRELSLQWMVLFLLASVTANILLSFMMPVDFIDLSGGGIIGIFLLLICRCTKGAIGIGDGILFSAIGMSVGFVETIQISIASFLLSSLVAIIELLIFHRKKEFTIPFAPFVLFGIITSLCF